MKLSRMAFVTSMILIGFALNPGIGVMAHPRSDFYSKWWQVDLTPEWHFDENVPSGNRRDRIKDGAQEWNAVNSPMSFNWQSGDLSAVDWSDCPDDASKSSVHWVFIDGESGILGQTRVCEYAQADSLKTFHIKFDDGENNWYTGTGNPGGNEDDLWSVAAHEFGHGTGFGVGNAQTHFGAGSNECTNTPKQTMCSTLPEGSSHWRSLEEHDKHTFQNRYP